MEGSLSLTVVDEAEGVVVVFGGKVEGIVCGEGVVRDGRSRNGTSDGTKGGVIVVRSDTISRLKVDEFRDVLVAVKGIEELIASGIGEHEEQARRSGLGWIPNEEIHLRIIIECI